MNVPQGYKHVYILRAERWMLQQVDWPISVQNFVLKQYLMERIYH